MFNVIVYLKNIIESLTVKPLSPDGPIGPGNPCKPGNPGSPIY